MPFKGDVQRYRLDLDAAIPDPESDSRSGTQPGGLANRFGDNQAASLVNGSFHGSKNGILDALDQGQGRLGADSSAGCYIVWESGLRWFARQSADGASIRSGAARKGSGMTATRFHARAVRQIDTDRWTVDTNIDGLFVEAATESECLEVIAEFAPELIRENYGVAVVRVPAEDMPDRYDLAWSLPATA